MSGEPTCVLDSSALLAFLRSEPGRDVVAIALSGRSAMSAANWAETLSKLSELGCDPDAEAQRLVDQGIVGNALIIFPFDEAGARAAARLRAVTRTAGLSLGDRACLALGIAMGLPVLTADRVWETLATGAAVRVIR